MKWIHRILPVLIVASGLAILALKFYKPAAGCTLLCKNDGAILLDKTLFVDEVVRRYGRIEQTPLHLVVFMDPMKDCAACLFEMQEWVEPLRQSEDYGLTMLVPEDTPPEAVAGIIDAHGLEKDCLKRFEVGENLAELNRFGVFKVFYSLENGVEWYELGNQTETEYREFAERVAARARSLKTP